MGHQDFTSFGLQNKSCIPPALPLKNGTSGFYKFWTQEQKLKYHLPSSPSDVGLSYFTSFGLRNKSHNTTYPDPPQIWDFGISPILDLGTKVGIPANPPFGNVGL